MQVGGSLLPKLRGKAWATQAGEGEGERGGKVLMSTGGGGEERASGRESYLTAVVQSVH